jgi:hypothetical protein
LAARQVEIIAGEALAVASRCREVRLISSFSIRRLMRGFRTQR